MKTQDAYTRWSTTYDSDRNRTRDLDQLATETILTDRRYHNILEIGCGTGKNTLLLEQIGRRVLAVDFSAGMLLEAKKKIRSTQTFFAIADLTQPWPCKSGSFELVVCNLVLEHIENLAPIFADAFRALTPGGEFLVSELHPFRQYQGTQANFRTAEETVEIETFVHHLSDFTEAAHTNGLKLQKINEWWHEEDKGRPPRLISLLFQK
jgi:ubiquinone/menaquinone biosynthesis C-methylase UbiE